MPIFGYFEENDNFDYKNDKVEVLTDHRNEWTLIIIKGAKLLFGHIYLVISALW